MIKNKKVIYSTKWLAYTALLTAFVVATMAIPAVPTVAGRIYWVDGMVLFAAYLLDPFAAFIAGGVGSLLYDAIQAPHMMLATLLIHGLQGATVSFLLHCVPPRNLKKLECVKAAVCAVIGGVIVVAGYFIYRYVTSGLAVAVASIPRNVIQEVIGICIATAICYGTTVKTQLVKRGLLPDFKREILDHKTNNANQKEVKTMKSKRILTMQDLSCVGQCSLTVALPILSRYGIETCVLPTAVLSNHTMFKGWSYLDLTPEIPAIYGNWKNNGIKFDAFLLGYLGKAELMELAEKCFDEFSADGAPVIIDPVFGDNGKLYGGFDLDYVAAMRKLIRRADIILPNVTEACFLTETEYRQDYDGNFINLLAEKLAKLTNAEIIITGVEYGGKIGEYIHGKGKCEIIWHELLPVKKHGTGDIFASVFTANYLMGEGVHKSCLSAAKFVTDSIKITDGEHFYGVNFEKILKKS